MDCDEAPQIISHDAGVAAPAKVKGENAFTSAQDVILIAASWAVLAALISYPTLQLIAFGAVICRVGRLNKARKDP